MPVTQDHSAADASTICEVFQATAAKHADDVALRTRGDEVTVTWAEYADNVRSLAAGFSALGVRPGDTLATQLVNRPEFHMVDMAAAHLGGVPFGVYNTSTSEQIEQRLDNADCRVIVTEMQFLDTVRKAAELYGKIDHIVLVDQVGDYEEGRVSNRRDEEGTMTLDDVKAAGSPGFEFDAVWKAVGPDDLLTMIYTSGTTGPPKGAMWTHGAVVRFLRNFGEVLPLPTNSVSYLPLAHAGERLLTHYMPLAHGARVTCCPDVRQVIEHIMDARPHHFVTVPRTWAKLKGAMLAWVDSLEEGPEKAGLKEAIAVGAERVGRDWDGEPVSDDLAARHEAAMKLMREKMLGRFGLDDLEIGIIGSAPPPAEDVKFFLSVGVPLLEAYGLTEATGFAGAWSRLENNKFGTVGRALPGVEIKLADDSEILLRSDMNMAGYRKEPEATAATLDPDGWLHTGDLGSLDEDGFLKIIGRKKALIINANGKNMSPENIETEIRKESALIGQIVAIGDDRDFVSAIITLDPEHLGIFAKQQSIEGQPTPANLAEHPAILENIQEGIDRGNERLSTVEQVRAFRVLPLEWQPDSDELTPTMKVRRKPVEDKYSDVIEPMYTKESA